jgi:hypothetical protein
MSANVEAMVREGINAYKAGNKEEAKVLLLKATDLDQMNEQAWLWLSGLMESVPDQRTCLENVLAINPNNERAKQGLSFLTGQTSAGNPSPFAASSAPPPAPSPTSIEWSVPDDSPPPSAAAPVDASPMIPDDWVSNLNLPVNDTRADTSASSTDSPTSPFGNFSFEDEDDTFGGPFSAPSLDIDDANTSQRRSPAPAPLPEPTRRANLPREPEPVDYEPEPEPAAELFGYIPKEIKATRLPGTRERTPLLLTLGLIVLILLNLGAASLLMINLLT